LRLIESRRNKIRMCVVAIAFDAHPEYRLVLAANRDEYHKRPSAPLARWPGAEDHIIAGRDLQSGGTWLGVSEQGRVAVVTNIRTGMLPDPDKASRGALVADYLRNGSLPALDQMDRFNAVSLLAFGPDGATLCANRPEPMMEPLAPGIHGLSNGEPHASWPRKERLMQAFAECLESEGDFPETLLTLLSSQSIDDSIFIKDEVYGTRCSTVVLVGREGTGMIMERSFGIDGDQMVTHSIGLCFL
jgi:uncharacterized protein with NRDE domain